VYVRHAHKDDIKMSRVNQSVYHVHLDHMHRQQVYSYAPSAIAVHLQMSQVNQYVARVL
jgi:hypothetical protein